MSQPIDVGTVLGGRYKVTSSVLTSAEGDIVLQGIDQVLNRHVSIAVAAPENAEQMTASAREIATGERVSNVQVLDLGVSEGATYLITNTADATDLLDLMVATEGPYVEPFYTDTLGSEIFGQSRSREPQTYEDDPEYYAELEDAERQRPLGERLPEINISDRLAGLKARFSRDKHESVEDSDDAGTGLGAAAPGVAGAAAASAGAADSGQSYAEPSTDEPEDTDGWEESEPTGPQETVAPTAAVPTSSKVTVYEDEDTDGFEAASPAAAPVTAHVETVSDAPAEHASNAGRHGAGAAGIAAAGASAARPASTFPQAARDYQDEELLAAGAGARSAFHEEEEESGGSRWTRLIVGAILGLVLILAVVFAFNTLGGGGKEPVAQDPSSSTPASPSGDGSDSPSPSASETRVTPVVADVERVVPGNQALNADTDSTLSALIDGNEASLYSSYSFTQPNFGGFASNMILVVELEELSDINEVALSGLNGSGGSYEIAVGETNDFGSAETVTQGSFTGPTVTVPVGSEGETMKGQYVFFNVTELPRLANPFNASRPYGLQLAEITVN